MTTASDAAARARLAAINQGPGDIAERNAANTVIAAYGRDPRFPQSGISSSDITRARLANINNLYNTQVAQARPTATPRLPNYGSTGGGGSRRGGGGGGAAPAPTMNQAMLDWIAGLLKGGAPTAQGATNLDLPDYAGRPLAPFDPSMFNQFRESWNQGVQSDLANAQTATSNMLNFLNTNYTNAFNNPNLTYATAGQAPGMTQQAMARYLQGQGVNPSLGAGVAAEQAQGDAGFGSLWRTLAANEDLAQRNRIANAQQYGTQAQQGITAAGRGGELGINLAQGQAQAAWQRAAEERAYQDYQMQQQIAQQEALQSWQRANQVTDANTAATNAYRNSELSALLGLMPQIVAAGGGLNLPSLQSLGLAA